MIPLSSILTNPNHWRTQLANAFVRVHDLLAFLELESIYQPEMTLAGESFGLRVPRYFAGLMKKGDPTDPLLRQVLPVGEELLQTPGFQPDPLEDAASCRGQGILQKYHGRALLITTGACAVNCRYCFRRHFPYTRHQVRRDFHSQTLPLIEADESISEIILSGGDPLMLSNRRLASLIAQLENLPQLKRLRIHTRLPVVLPQRLEPPLVRTLLACNLPLSLVIQINHPREITPELGDALHPLAGNLTLLNQSVLLKGINDHADTQIKLCEKLYTYGILPYYLHQLDKVKGAAHYNVEDHQAHLIHEQMRNRLPGYLLPRLVREVPGKRAKQPL